MVDLSEKPKREEKDSVLIEGGKKPKFSEKHNG